MAPADDKNDATDAQKATFKKNLNAARRVGEDDEITIPTLAQLTGIGADNIRAWLRKENLPSASRLAKIARALRVSTDFLLGLAPEPSGLTPGTILVDDLAIRQILDASGDEVGALLEKHKRAHGSLTVEVPVKAKLLTELEASVLEAKLLAHIDLHAPGTRINVRIAPTD